MERVAAVLVNETEPVCVELKMRESETAPCRIKVAFVTEITETTAILADGERTAIPAEAQGKTISMCEFRLEMN